MKSQVRNDILTKRNALSPEAVSDAELKILDRLRHWPIYIEAENVMTYVDFKNEIRTRCIMEDLLSNGKKLIVPLTKKNSTDIIPVQISSFKELKAGQFGLTEPSKESREFNSELLDLILIPGIAFDVYGNRIGFGKGYYDHFLSQIDKKVPFASLAYDFQVLNYVIPHDKHDVPMDFIITPSKTIEIK